ncbi:hypothetical protein CHCC20339_3523 [Bacillus licheniformis]|nr:hypothetical protein CHCC20339_3523 [Bacillus licheniformis]
MWSISNFGTIILTPPFRVFSPFQRQPLRLPSSVSKAANSPRNSRIIRASSSSVLASDSFTRRSMTNMIARSTDEKYAISRQRAIGDGSRSGFSASRFGQFGAFVGSVK